jgi:hypothetical protein
MNRHAIADMDLRAKLAEHGLECHLLASQPQSREFPELLVTELGDLLHAAYGRDVTPEHLAYETWAVTLRPSSAGGAPVACCTLSFYSDFPSYFITHFEAVHPDQQKKGLGRLLYECIIVWTRFLVFGDVLVLNGVMQSDGDYCLVSVIDAEDQPDWEDIHDNEHGHGAFLRKLGFIRAQHDFRQTEDEIAFQRAFHIPELAPAARAEESP